MADQFRDDAGRLTEYSFRCGYLETKSTDTSKEGYRTTDLYTEMGHEGAVYFVKQYDRRSGACERVFWETFDDDAEGFAAARRLFDEQPGELKRGG